MTRHAVGAVDLGIPEREPHIFKKPSKMINKSNFKNRVGHYENRISRGTLR